MTIERTTETTDDAAASEQRAAMADLEGQLSTITASVLAKHPEVIGVLLVGSFARGEGGFVERQGRLVPHNDLDLVVVVKEGARALREPLAKLGHELTRAAGVDVDLWPIEEATLADPPKTLFWLDVALGGGRVLHGPSELLPLGRVRASEVPLDEAARLLANRATGIALSRLAGEAEDPLRFHRHVHKAILACGDALLLERGLYAATITLRNRQLALLAEREPELSALSGAYDDARLFRLRPDRWTEPEHPRAWRELRIAMVRGFHLRFEARRLGTAPTLLGLVETDQPQFALTDAHPVRRWGSLAFQSFLGVSRPELLHARERLARASIALAYAPDAPGTRALAARWLGVCITGDAAHDGALLTEALESMRAQGG